MATGTEDQKKQEREKREREARQREKDLQAIPLQPIDQSTWPKTALYWNGKPVEIIGQRLDLTRTQAWVAIAIAVFTGIAAVGTAVQGSTAYHVSACKTGWWTFAACPPNSVSGYLLPSPTGSSQPNPQPQLNGDHYR